MSYKRQYVSLSLSGRRNAKGTNILTMSTMAKARLRDPASWLRRRVHATYPSPFLTCPSQNSIVRVSQRQLSNFQFLSLGATRPRAAPTWLCLRRRRARAHALFADNGQTTDGWMMGRRVTEGYKSLRIIPPPLASKSGSFHHTLTDGNGSI